ncbi:hypothetical protein E4T47_05147 [Aureobasidium subglaciale]|nr:hypothetical protein E4T47_05147 [Aureobasidium subglaciale]
MAPTLPVGDSHPKRIILRLSASDFDGPARRWQDHLEAVQVYLRWAGYPDEPGAHQHFIHAEPFQPVELQPKRFHVFIDIDYQSFASPDMGLIQHEIYAVKCNDDGQLIFR